MKLGDILIGRGLITQQQLDHALHVQKRFGGKLGSSLVELGYVTEEELATHLSAQLKIPFVRAEAVASIPPEVIAYIPRDVAEKYRVVPLRVEGRELHICLANPNDLACIDEIGFALGCRLRAHVITEVTLDYALERYYQIRRERRFNAENQKGTPAPTPFENAVSADFGATPVRIPAVSRGPSMEELCELLSQAMTEVQVFEMTGRLLCSFFDEAVVMQVRGGHAYGAASHARNGARRNVRAFEIAISDSPMLTDLLSKRRVTHRAQLTDHALVYACAASGVPIHLVTLLPIADRPETVEGALVVLAHGCDAPRLQQHFDSIKQCLTKIAAALQIVALRKQIRTPATWSGSWMG